jgi:hypothetical protein
LDEICKTKKEEFLKEVIKTGNHKIKFEKLGSIKVQTSVLETVP